MLFASTLIFTHAGLGVLAASAEGGDEVGVSPSAIPPACSRRVPVLTEVTHPRQAFQAALLRHARDHHYFS